MFPVFAQNGLEAIVYIIEVGIQRLAVDIKRI